MDVFCGRAPEHAVSPDEISGWFGRRQKPNISEAHCFQVAMFINNCRWPGDPETPCHLPDSFEQHDAEVEDRFRNLANAAQSAQTLLRHLPNATSFWTKQHPANRSDDALRTLNDLNKVLESAFPYLAFPYGPSTSERGRPRASKPWHVYAITIGATVFEMMIKAGHHQPPIARSSAVVRIVRSAMIRMNIDQAKTLSESAISIFLVRWNKSYGLGTLSSSKSTTNSASPNL